MEISVPYHPMTLYVKGFIRCFRFYVFLFITLLNPSFTLGQKGLSNKLVVPVKSVESTFLSKSLTFTRR